MAVNINIPSQVRTFANLAAFPATGAVKTIYIAEDTNKTYRWTGSVYVEISGADFSGYVPTSRTLTINGVAQDLSADRSWTIATGLTVGTTPISSGTNGRVLFQGTGNVLQQSSSLFWDSTNNRLGIGTSTPEYPLDILGNLSGFNIGFKLRNSATSGYTEIMCFNNGGTLADRMYMGVGGTTTGDAFQNRGYFVASNNLEGVNFTATKPTTGDIRFFTGGVNERLRIHGSGNVGINTTTDAGFRLDVNGTARVQGNLTTTSGTRVTVGNIEIFDNTAGTRSINALGNQNLTITANSTNILLNNSTGANGAMFLNATGSDGRIFLRPNSSNSGIVFSGSSNVPSFNQMTFLNNRNDGIKSAIINTVDFAASGQTPINLFIYAGRETVSNNQANLILCHDGTSSRGNVLINTTTDAGFRLDVNGTARIATSLVVGGTGSGSLTTSVVRCNFLNTSDNGFSVVQFQTLSGNATFFQSVSIGSGANPLASAQLEVASTTKGFLPPRMTTTQKNAIASPATGLQVYDTTLNQMSYYNGTTWTNI